MAGDRRYCWRVGTVFVYAEGERCPECGSVDHGFMPDDLCGDATYRGPEGITERLYHCVRLPDHEGPCQHAVKDG